MGRKQNKKRKQRYPVKALVPLYWITVGLSFIGILVFSIAVETSLLTWLILWTPFMVGAIFYSNYYQRQGIRICPNCGKYAYRGRVYCEKCGARVFWECPKCHKKSSRSLKFCKDCGQNLKVVTFARQMELEGEVRSNEGEPAPKTSNVVVTGSVVQFCPSCGAEISEDLTHCSICGSKFDR